MNRELTIRRSTESDLPALESIRVKAFAPIFASFRNLLGGRLYSLAQEPEDTQQGQMLVDLFSADSIWQVYVVELSGRAVGFVSIRLDLDSKVGEIGLNAVDPDHAGQGIGTEMYRFAIDEMKQAGMLAATVATGADSGHEPARRAYEKAGFNVTVPSVWMCQEL